MKSITNLDIWRLNVIDVEFWNILILPLLCKCHFRCFIAFLYVIRFTTSFTCFCLQPRLFTALHASLEVFIFDVIVHTIRLFLKTVSKYDKPLVKILNMKKKFMWEKDVTVCEDYYFPLTCLMTEI